MPNNVITLEKIVKAYNIYNHPLDRVKEAFHPFRKKYCHRFYALKDITFNVKRGESIGIIGKNGSGKSTLLKLISGIIPPTSGRLEVFGKIAALLELGTGFNPEFTGRENIFLNAALLGLTSEEIRDCYDDIVTFSGVGDFIRQPLKQYSSGMVIRLAFSIATHVWADTLIIDEALAVGDEAFQRKCFALLQDHKRRGNTLIFVSHSSNAVIELCDRALLLEDGNLLLNDEPKICVREYHKRLFSSVKTAANPAEKTEEKEQTNIQKMISERDDQSISAKFETSLNSYREPGFISQSTVSYACQGAQISNTVIRDPQGREVNTFYPGEICFFSYEAEFFEDSYQVVFGSMIKTISGLELGGMISHPLASPIPYVACHTVAEVRFGFACRMMPGVYFFNAGITGYKDGTQTYLHRVIDAVMFRVQAKEGLLATGTVDFLEKPMPTVTLRPTQATVAAKTG